MAEFINTIDALGDDVVIDSLIQGTITEFKDNVLTVLRYGPFASRNTLKTLDLPSVTYSDGDTLKSCTALTSVKLPKLQTLAQYMFYGCSSLPSIVLPKTTNLSAYCFGYCRKLASVDLSANVTIHGGAFGECNALARLILRNAETVATLNDGLSQTPIASGTGYIYVPRALVDSYKAATNWSNFAAQIRALEDYTVDGTITGELDETKI